MSNAFSIVALLACLNLTEEHHEHRAQWSHGKTSVRSQLWILSKLPEYKSKESKFDYVEAIASDNVADVNKWFAKRGSDISFDESLDFAAGAIGRLRVEWEFAGEVTELETAKGTVPAAKMASCAARYHKTEGNTIFALSCKNGDIVCMQIADKPKDDVALFNTCFDAMEQRATIRGYQPGGGLIFPMIKLKYKPDLYWLKGLRYGNVVVQEAKAFISFAMDHLGATVVDEAGIGATKGVPPAPDKIEQPFICWIERPGVNFPLCTFWCGYDSMKNPNEN